MSTTGPRHTITLEIDVTDAQAENGEPSPIIDTLTKVAETITGGGFTVRIHTERETGRDPDTGERQVERSTVYNSGRTRLGLPITTLFDPATNQDSGTCLWCGQRGACAVTDPLPTGERFWFHSQCPPAPAGQ
ncbi:hypothetical protein [Nocardia sp. SC052]|uniref:hypothetical protein n=1 Tax=Nocardia sichangensis TaxID=3385975 RepID=UPI00399F9364